MQQSTRELMAAAFWIAVALVLAAVFVVLALGCDEGGGGVDADECDQDDCDIECPPDTCQDEHNLIRYDQECYGWDNSGEPICECVEDVKHCDLTLCTQGDTKDYCDWY